MIDLARHVSAICAQIIFVAKHATRGCNNSTETTSALNQIVAGLRRAADVIECEAARREGEAVDQAKRAAMLRRESEQTQQHEK